MQAIRQVAERASAPNMGQWFRRMADHGTWSLALHKSDFRAMRAGYQLSCPGLRGAEVSPPSKRAITKRVPSELAEYYRLVRFVDWMGFGASGGIEDPNDLWQF